MCYRLPIPEKPLSPAAMSTGTGYFTTTTGEQQVNSGGASPQAAPFQSTVDVNAILEQARQLKEAAGRPLGTEGEPTSGWVLIDYGDVVVHLFLPDVRKRYNLEELWKDAQTVVHIQ